MNEFLFFGFGLTLGSFICTTVMHLREQKRFETALDTVGIRRSEFMKLKAEVAAISKMLVG